ncbi:MAG: phosphoglycerate dehydrogenase [Phycisphaeraceae bacterium]|nr:phosphoglycerate dehydrogenase [Phycisphaeraceae bacterium]
MTKTSYPKDKIRVLLCEKIHPAADEDFLRAGFRVERAESALEGARLRELAAGGGNGSGGAGAHVLGIRSASRVTAEDLAGLPRLLAVGCFCIGTNQTDARAANLAGVPIFNSPFCNTRSVAELTVAEIVSLCRGLFVKSRQMHEGRWDKSAAGAHEVRGRTLGLVGYGRIGTQVSILAEAMGMRVIYFDVAPTLPMGNARGVRTLEELLGQSDVVSLHVPATRGTANLIGAKQLGMMKPGAMLINNARGSVVDVGALAEALKSGRIGGAAVDVFPDEPSSNQAGFDSPLRGLPNVILTPHVAGSTLEAQEAIAHDVAEKLIRFVNNGTTAGAVNVPQVELPDQGSVEQGVIEAVRTDGVEGGANGAEAEESAEGQRAVRRHRILHFHRNVPGVLSKMHSAIAELGVNVAAEYLQTNAEVGYVVLDVDPGDGEAIMERLRAIPETIRLRMLW